MSSGGADKVEFPSSEAEQKHADDKQEDYWQRWEQMAEVWLLLEGQPAEGGLTVFCTRILLEDREELEKGVKGERDAATSKDLWHDQAQDQNQDQDQIEVQGKYRTGKDKKRKKRAVDRGGFEYVKVSLSERMSLGIRYRMRMTTFFPGSPVHGCPNESIPYKYIM